MARKKRWFKDTRTLTKNQAAQLESVEQTKGFGPEATIEESVFATHETDDGVLVSIEFDLDKWEDLDNGFGEIERYYGMHKIHFKNPRSYDLYLKMEHPDLVTLEQTIQTNQEITYIVPFNSTVTINGFDITTDQTASN